MSPGTSLDPAAVRDRLITELHRGAVAMQLVALRNGPNRPFRQRRCVDNKYYRARER
jgi:hypothetical protein